MNQKPYLLYVLTEDWGLFTHRIDLVRRAQQSGYRVGIACSVKEYGDKIKAENFDLYPLKHLKRGSLNPFQDLRSFWELLCLYRKIRPDLVHQVALKPVLYGTLAARLTKVSGIVNALGGLGYLFIGTSFKIRSIRFFLLKILKYIFHRKNLVLILQNSDDISVFKSILNPQQLYLVRGSGVDLKIFQPAPVTKQKAQGDIKVIFCARLLWDKGIGEVMEAARLLKKKKIPLRIQIVGCPDPENPSSISESLLTSWAQEDVVDFLGNRKDIQDLLDSADVAILPSYREGLPKALLEAAAMALPIVTTNVPGCREVVQEGVNGFLIPPKNSEKLAEALEILAQNSFLRKKMGKESQKLVQKFFSEEKINTEILEIYQEMGYPSLSHTSRKA